jgi:patatin-like phospholipase/acyl hydrolase
MSKLIKILSIDGGGIRGIIPAKVLSYIEEKTDQRICQMFDLICGTSTGGILALGLTKPDPNDRTQPHYRAEDLIKIYEEKGQTIFSRNIWQKIHSAWNLTDEKYDSLGIESVLWDYFKDVFLSEALTELLIPSYEIENRDCFFFKTSLAKVKRQTHDFLMRQVARSTSAAPTYFEPCRMAAEHDPDDPSDPNKTKPYWALIDGGVFANNPAMCGFAEALSIYGPGQDYLVVSLGTGQLTRPIPYDSARDWGLAGWAQNIISVIFDGVQDTVHYQLKQLLPSADGTKKRYYRFQVELDMGMDDMDDASETNLFALQHKADELIAQETKALGKLCQLLKQG